MQSLQEVQAFIEALPTAKKGRLVMCVQGNADGYAEFPELWGAPRPADADGQKTWAPGPLLALNEGEKTAVRLSLGFPR